MKTSAPAKNLRARDTDRADVCALLDAALADGQLSTAEHDSRTATAMRAGTFGALDRLVDDLQIPGGLAATPIARGLPRAPRRWWIPVGAVVLAGLLGAGAGLLGRSPTPAPPLPDLTTGNGLAQLITDYRTEFGTTEADELSVFPDRAEIARSGQPGKQETTRYTGEFEQASAPARRTPDTRSFDLATLDLPRYARLIAGAPQTTRLPDGQVWHVTIEYPPGADKYSEPLLSIYVKNEAEQIGYLQIRLNGEVSAVYPA
ncbi:DUF1707 domain-containing protein [Nocardia sp. NPDC059177]|uniref:DUF1707 SHOCT-like domain-containing protein n=1 Tax=Nocardia sp. NPDC059177 TaxID=3346759 RepID=UPI0036CDE680